MSLLTKVLLVDDDSTANFLHQLLLKRMDVAEQVLVAGDGQQALDLLAAQATPPQLILLDLNMPVMNGLEFLTHYAQLPEADPKPIVVILSSADQGHRQAYFQELPVSAFLEKPLTRDNLGKVLEQYFIPAA